MIGKGKRLLAVLIGSFILAAGMCNIHAYAGVTEGGVLGLTLLLRHWTGISPALSSVILDALCYLIGWRCLGRGFLLYTAVGSLSYAAFYALLEPFAPVVPALVTHPLLCALLGALFVGVGCGLAVSAGGACGGDDAIAMVICAKTRLSIRQAYLFTDVSVLLLSLTYIPARKIIFSLITVTLSGCIVGWVQDLWRKKEGKAG